MSPSRSKQNTAARTKRRNVGAYSQPFSGIGMEFQPLGAPCADIGFVLHEAGYLPKLQDWNFPNVYSPFWRIYYTFEEGHYVRFGNKRTPLGPDRVLVIPNHQRFDCESESSVASLWFSFSSVRHADPSQSMPIVIPTNDTIAALVEEFPPWFLGRKQNRSARIRSLSLAFILYILSQPKIRWQKPLPENIAVAIELINRSPAFPWTITRLARHVGMSTDGFSRLFRQWMQISPVRYVQQVRIREACRMLIESDESIDRIADQIGFADRFHFTRVFKRLTDTTPARYRKQHETSDV